MSDNMDIVEEDVKINESLLEDRVEEKIVCGQSVEKDESHVIDSKQINENDNQNIENINDSIEEIREKTVEIVPNMKNTSEIELKESISPALVCDVEGVDITEEVDIGSGKQEQCNTKSNKLTDQIPESTSKTEAEIETNAEKKVDTEIKVLELNISNNDTTGELMEVDTQSLDYLGGNDDSQESLPLVIDEKPASPKEGNENDEPSTSLPKNSLTTNSINEEGLIENNSCGVNTQIDHNKKDTDKPEDGSRPENIIEIDDENEETKPEEDPDVEITATRSPSYIPIIEIDDDDDEDELNKDNKIAQISEKKDESVVSAADTQIAAIFNDNRKNTINDDNKEERVIEDVAMKDPSDKDEVTEQPDLLKLTALQPEPQDEINSEQTNCEDTVDEVFYKQECVNHDCPHNHKQFFLAPPFTLSHFKVKKRRTQKQFICSECFDCALDAYEEYCGLLKAKQPLLLKNITVQGPEFVEITDSSDDDEETSKTQQIQTGKGSFSKVSLDLVEAELENSIKNVLEKLDIQSQLTWSKTILETRARRLEVESDLNDKLLRTLQKKADQMYSSLYQCPKIRLRQFQPLDLNTNLPYNFPEVTPCPPVGEIMRPPIEINQVYYAVKNKAIASWVPCRVVEQMDTSSILGAHNRVPIYKVKFLKLQYQMVKTVSAKHLAYFDPPKFRLPIGSRVIAYFDATSLSRGKEKMMIQSAFYPGIIAEPLKPNNKYRYLIFYDDGYTQYVSHKDVRLVCNVSEHVWEDVHPASREFIQKYLTQYSINRPMVQTQKGQSMTTESNGKWIYARVVDIDCSLIQMQFEGPKSHTEWIYRGSLRLGPVFKEYQKTLQKDTLPIPRLARRTEPFIRYTADEEATTAQQEQVKEREREQRVTSNEPRAVAKKSVSRLSTDSTATLSTVPSPTTSLPTVRHLNNSTIYLEDENKPKGKVVYYTAKRDLPPLIYRPHKCSPTCLFKIPHNLSAYSPLSKPLLSGWERPILRLKSKKIVAYRGPCGKIMRNMEEVRRYLRATENALNVDNFDFHHETSCLAEYVIESAIVQKRDISGGQEKMAIPLVNYYDNTLPPECKYAAQRIPTDGVNLNLDSEFLVGCDCEGDCSDKAKCSCWQLTYAGAKYGNPNTPMEEIGYQYKRLYEHVPTGIYECNSRCKCKSNCLNRVAQQPLAMKLQVFKTSNRGWGLRCINDVPRGSFVCIYAGHLLTEAKANEGGLDAGDEYFAELDYIEVAEQIKEGYESDVEPPEVEEEEDAYAPDPEDDDEFTPSKSFLTRAKNKAQKLTRSSSAQNTDEDSQERQVINFNPNADMNEDSARESSIRALFGKDEACYVMDAKITGNLGRYFNHSCSPNLFVQNVFVDTHDLRFPWVAFFSSTNIRAGTELTWNYNYEVGVVPGKVLYCQCGAPNCRLRLL